ncbi:MAG: 3-isopropylmalate dehydratase small subunit [Alphaproteobacteria bacterium]|nr:3-isopropylmalate dehydratase small subunit [Alphaproteobacteria bacterium]
MRKFTVLKATSAAMPLPNIDTDTIIPARFLKTIKRTGLGKSVFYPLRYDDKGNEKATFILNQEPFRTAKILVAGDNFGCGSSREHAPWALADFGITCVISTSFADIFFNNCAKNGILCITRPKADVDKLMKDAQQGATMTVDLDKQIIVRPDGSSVRFDVEPNRKHSLLNGLDDVGLTLQREAAISSYEQRTKTERPWI